MEKYRCIVHNIVLQIDGNQRHFDLPPGSWEGIPPCNILTMHPVKEGKSGDCEIVKEE